MVLLLSNLILRVAKHAEIMGGLLAHAPSKDYRCRRKVRKQVLVASPHVLNKRSRAFQTLPAQALKQVRSSPPPSNHVRTLLAHTPSKPFQRWFLNKCGCWPAASVGDPSNPSSASLAILALEQVQVASPHSLKCAGCWPSATNLHKCWLARLPTPSKEARVASRHIPNLLQHKLETSAGC